MVTETIVRVVLRLAPEEDDHIDILNGLLHGDENEEFPGLLELLSLGVPKNVEDQEVQNSSAQVAVWASKILFVSEAFDLGEWLEEGHDILTSCAKDAVADLGQRHADRVEERRWPPTLG